MILLPVFLLTCVLIAATCLYFSTLSDVQQLASDMTRLSLTYVDRNFAEDAVCNSLKADILPHLIDELHLLSQSRVVDITCQSGTGVESFAVAVRYDMSGTLPHRLGALAGFSISSLAGSAEMLL